MPRQKMVNGVLIDLTEAELAEIEARVEASDLDLTMVRADRRALLRNSDWTQVADVALSAEKVAEWATYRQEL